MAANDTLGLNIVFPILKSDGTQFHDLVIHKATVESVVMSLGDKITGDVYYKDNALDVTMHEYIEYKGVKYVLVNPPTILREGMMSDNSELKGMTKYSFVFYHPMYQLSNMPFTDVAVTQSQEAYLSENRSFSWIGTSNDFIAKLNTNLNGTQWTVVKSSRFPLELENKLSEVISFDNAMIADALKTWYDTWGIPYVIDQVASTESSYAQGKRFKVVMGLPSNEIYESAEEQQLDNPFVFEMGKGVGLKNNSRTPRNNKIITRIAGYGSERNIPYGYPQIVWTGDEDDSRLQYPLYDGIVGGQAVKLIKHPFTRSHLMPSVYSERVNKKVNPNATGYNPNISLIDYYDATGATYPNNINPLAPSYDVHEFEDIYPELGSAAIVSATPLNPDLTPAAAWDDTMDDDGSYVQSYFSVALPQLAFDLYACAAITESMELNMRSGACLGCTFPVQVDWDEYKKNFYHEDGTFDPIPHTQDGDGHVRDITKFPKSDSGSITIILQKETQTFGTLMPNVYQYPQSGDNFVILGISLPLSYITNAESRLDTAMTSYMLENNVYYYDYPLKFDEHFLATHTYILQQIRPNTVVNFKFAGDTLSLFVKQLTVKYGEKVLPQYDITLTDNANVVLNQIGRVAEDVEKLSTLIAILRQNYGSSVWAAIAKKLSKTNDDKAQGFIGFLKGIWIGVKNKFGWTADGDITARNIKASDKVTADSIRAGRAVVNEQQSDDFSGSGLTGSGYILTKWHNGHSYLAIDELDVRMKANFASVEIREETFTGGNQHLSPAGSVIKRVEYIGYEKDDNGNTIYGTNGEPVEKVIGFQTIVVPWLLGGEPFPFAVTNQLSYASSVEVRKMFAMMSDAEREAFLDEIVKFRCYLVADDGTTRTRNWWKAGDQALCQTHNIIRREERDVEIEHGSDDIQTIDGNASDGDTVTMQNVFFWRRVMGTGSKLNKEDGKFEDYADLSNVNTGSKTNYVEGSDIPAAGDTIVAFGNDSDVERMGIISLETYNSGDATRGETPAIKMFAGVNTMNRSDLANKRTAIISPGLVEFRSSIFRIVSRQGSSVPIVNPRGAYSSTAYYYYFDLVTYNGSSWLCVIDDTLFKWVELDSNGNITAYYSSGEATLDENEVYMEGAKGHLDSDSDVEVVLSRNFVVGSEPSKTNTDWQIYVEKGAKGDKGEDGTLSEEDLDELKGEIVDELSGIVEAGLDGLTIVLDPSVIIVEQTDITAYSTANGVNRTRLRVYRSGVAVAFKLSNITNSAGSANAYTTIDGTTTISSTTEVTDAYLSLDSITNTYNSTTGEYTYGTDNGKITFTLTVDGKPYAMSIKWFLNRLGNRETKIRGDVETTIAKRTEWVLDASGSANLLSDTNPSDFGSKTNGHWESMSGGSLFDITDSPVDGYTKGFRITGNTSGVKQFAQRWSFWAALNAYHFTAYVRGVSGNATAIVSIGSVVSKSQTVGTSWSKLDLYLVVPKEYSGSGAEDFLFGISGAGSIEYVAPYLTLMTDASAIRTDYIARIKSAADGIEEEFEEILTDPNTGYATKSSLGDYIRSADLNKTTLEQYYGDSLVSQSVFEQTAGSISMSVLGGGIVLYNDTRSFSKGSSSSDEYRYNSAYNHINEIDQPQSGFYLKLSFVANISSSSTDGTVMVTAAIMKKNGGSSSVVAKIYSPQSAKGDNVDVRAENAVYLDSQVNSISTVVVRNTTGYSATIKDIKLTIVGEAEGGLAKTGIDITNGTINMQADNINLRNNSGEQTLGVDANGDVEVSGTIKAKNLYHGICINGSEEWCYVTRNTDGTRERGWALNTYQKNETPGSGIDGTVVCTYSADIVIVPNRYNNSNSRYVNLPRSRDFEGKIVEVYDNAYSNGQTMGVIQVSAVDGGVFSNGFGYTGAGDGYAGQSITINAGSKAKFYSVKSGSTWYWVKLEG